MPTYQFTATADQLGLIYDAIMSYLRETQGADRDFLESVMFEDVTPTDWAQTASDLASGDPARIEPHLPCPDCPHPLTEHDASGCTHHLPFARNLICVCKKTYRPQ